MQMLLIPYHAESVLQGYFCRFLHIYPLFAQKKSSSVKIKTSAKELFAVIAEAFYISASG
jgi:hypothetical protein